MTDYMAAAAARVTAKDAPHTASAEPISLPDLDRGTMATVTALLPPQTPEDRMLVQRLMQIGFVPGERLKVIAHGHPDREPIAVRIGGTAFALRRFEARYIQVMPDQNRGPR